MRGWDGHYQHILKCKLGWAQIKALIGCESWLVCPEEAHSVEPAQEGGQFCPLVCPLPCQDCIVPDCCVDSCDWVLSSSWCLILKQRHFAHPHQSQGLIHVRLQQYKKHWRNAFLSTDYGMDLQRFQQVILRREICHEVLAKPIEMMCKGVSRYAAGMENAYLCNGIWKSESGKSLWEPQDWQQGPCSCIAVWHFGSCFLCSHFRIDCCYKFYKANSFLCTTVSSAFHWATMCSNAHWITPQILKSCLAHLWKLPAQAREVHKPHLFWHIISMLRPAIFCQEGQKLSCPTPEITSASIQRAFERCCSEDACTPKCHQGSAYKQRCATCQLPWTVRLIGLGCGDVGTQELWRQQLLAILSGRSSALLVYIQHMGCQATVLHGGSLLLIVIVYLLIIIAYLQVPPEWVHKRLTRSWHRFGIQTLHAETLQYYYAKDLSSSWLADFKHSPALPPLVSRCCCDHQHGQEQAKPGTCSGSTLSRMSHIRSKRDSSAAGRAMFSAGERRVSYRPHAGFAAARTVVRVFRVVVIPAFAMLTVCCSITCQRMLLALQSRWPGTPYDVQHG